MLNFADVELPQMLKPSSRYKALFVLEKMVAEKRPALSLFIKKYGNMGVGEYLGKVFVRRKDQATVDPLSDVVESATAKVSSIHGWEMAKQLRARLTQFPVVNTGPHAGIHTDSPTYHWYLFDYLGEKVVKTDGGEFPPIVVAMTCGNIPMNNRTKPMGVIIGDRSFNLFTAKYAHVMTHSCPRFDLEMVTKFEAMLLREVKNQKLLRTLRFLLQELRTNRVLNQNSYVDQCLIVNFTIWDKVFAGFPLSVRPRLMTLELEEIANSVICRDLQNTESLIYKILFNEVLRGKVLSLLDGVQGCWNNNLLDQLALRPDRLEPAIRRERSKLGMTHFFWGIDVGLESHPLALVETRGKYFLRRVDASGSTPDLPLTPQSLLGAIEERKLVPSLFTSFLLTQFARGVKCLGGFNQEEYLNRMCKGISQALEEVGELEFAGKVSRSKSTAYLLNLPLVLSNTGPSSIRLAGPFDLIARKGGITQREFNKLKQVPLRALHLLSLPGITPIIVGRDIDETILAEARKEALEVSKKYLVWV